MIGGIVSFSFIDISVPWNVNSYWVKFNNNKTNKQKAPNKKTPNIIKNNIHSIRQIFNGHLVCA